jgi:biopolymer transport protein ExbD/biopolymer transport protein TolR
MVSGSGGGAGSPTGLNGSDDLAPRMNVTPLVDVVLVLLITFMVITPLLTKTFWVHTPAQRTEEVERERLADAQPLVLRITRDGALRVNGADTTLAELPDRLRRMFAARDDHVLFFDAADDASYGLVMQALDRAREGGAVTLGMLTSPAR